MTTLHPRIVAYWLLLIVFMVVGQCTIGAVTRLTESGLSIVEWKPVTGAVPPMNEADWQSEFDKYQTSPQYEKVNEGMTLPEFKNIFWWEWVHRLWARLIGVVFALPLAFFWVKRWIPQGYKPKLLGLFALGGAQGVMGWLMVASGLVDNPAVSHYRLAAHLLLALIIAVLALRFALPLLGVGGDLPAGLSKHGWATFGMLLVTIVWGAFVAGLDAGMIYNEFPMMGGQFFPSEGLALDPVLRNFVENHAAVQFVHRYLGLLTGLMAIAFAMRGLKLQPDNKAFRFVAAFGLIQPMLGVGTLLSQVNLHMAATHQLGAIALLLSLTWALSSTPGPAARS